MRPEFTKVQRRRIRELGRIAYERELSAELSKLESKFKRWRAGEIDAFGVANAIHRFHEGPSRKLLSSYEGPDLGLVVAHAIHRGLITEEEAGAEAIEMLGRHLALYRSLEGTARLRHTAARVPPRAGPRRARPAARDR